MYLVQETKIQRITYAHLINQNMWCNANTVCGFMCSHIARQRDAHKHVLARQIYNTRAQKGIREVNINLCLSCVYDNYYVSYK